MTKPNGAQEWDEIAAIVAENAEDLKELTSHGDLFRWAKDNDLATKTKFPKFKSELRKQIGHDYDELRAIAKESYEQDIQQKAQELNEKAEQGPRLVLNTAGDAEVGTYAVCAGESVLWYGDFFEDDKDYEEGDQTSADVSAMKKAVWLATKIKEAAEAETLMLELHVVNHEVPVPTSACVKAGLGLDFQIIDGVPANEWCRENGYKSWRQVSLPELVQAT